MWNRPTKRQLQTIPKLYETEQIPAKHKIIHMHFFFGGSDWYIAEFDGKDLFFGFAVLNGDYECAEWGYFSFTEIASINCRGFQADRNIHWKPVPAENIAAITERI